ncbi:MAG: IS3 family transposase [Sulfurimonadaceae bacterium]
MILIFFGRTTFISHSHTFFLHKKSTQKSSSNGFTRGHFLWSQARWLSGSQANQAIFEYIEVYYNQQRSHSSNNYMSPVAFENELLLNEIGA